MPTKPKHGVIPETTHLHLPPSPAQPPRSAAPEPRAPQPIEPITEGETRLPEIPLPDMIWKIYERMKRAVWLMEGGGSGGQAHRETMEINLASGATRTINFAMREIPRYWHIEVDKLDEVPFLTAGPLRVSEGGSVLPRTLTQDTRESMSIWPGEWKRMPARDKQLTLFNQGSAALHVTIHAVGRGEILQGLVDGRHIPSVQNVAGMGPGGGFNSLEYQQGTDAVWSPVHKAHMTTVFDITGSGTIWTPAAGKTIRFMGMVVACITGVVAVGLNVQDSGGGAGLDLFVPLMPGQTVVIPEFREGFLLSAPDNTIDVDGGVGNRYWGTVWGTEE